MVNYFYVENAFDGENVLTLDSSYGMTNVQYATDPTSSWKTVTFDAGTKKATITILQGGKVYLRGNNTALSNKDSKDNSIISCSQSFNVGGDLTTLLVPEGNVLDLTGKNYVFCYLFYNTKLVNVSKLILPATTLANSCYNQMFRGCTSLVIAPELPATTLAASCYAGMFMNCTSLTTAPVLPATQLADYCYNQMFRGCTSLVIAPKLSATTLAPYCYAGMFMNCTSLTTAPVLPATTLTKNCYVSMFEDCTSLTTAPELPATELADICYNSMFEGCTSLVTAPEILPATTLADSCYYEMFRDCTSLVIAPKLPATTLAKSCYEWMFYGCTSLTTAPELPATELADYCYAGMFQYCTSLVTAPVLPATKLAPYCYAGLSMFSRKGMFYGCKSLNKVTALFTDNSAQGCLDNWLSGTASTGTFIHNPKVSQAVLDSSNIPSGWDSKPYVAPNYFYIENIYDGENTLNIQNAEGRNLEYSTDGNIWDTYNFTSQPKLAKLGDRVYLRGTNNTFSRGAVEGNTINCSQAFAIGGDMTTLLVPEGNVLDLVGRDNVFRAMFKGANLVNIDMLILPSMKLSPNCYQSMFNAIKAGVIKITSTPKNLLPATTLAPWCYSGMFWSCDSLITAPDLPATTLAPYCYQYMFGGCKSLTTTPKLLAMKLSKYCYRWMFQYCESLKTPPELPATELAEGCYYGMFIDNFALESLPTLPAKVMKHQCYNYMFKWCHKIKEIPENYLPATELAEGCYCTMFFGIEGLEKVPENLLPAIKLAPWCYTGMFFGCKNLKNAPNLPATTLANYCYGGDPENDYYDYKFGMFQNCSSLTKTPIIRQSPNSTGCYNIMFQGCTNLWNVRVTASEWNSDNSKDWLAGTASKGLFECKDEIL